MYYRVVLCCTCIYTSVTQHCTCVSTLQESTGAESMFGSEEAGGSPPGVGHTVLATLSLFTAFREILYNTE